MGLKKKKNTYNGKKTLTPNPFLKIVCKCIQKSMDIYKYISPRGKKVLNM